MSIYAGIVVISWVVFMAVWLVSAFFTKRTVGSSWWRGWWVRGLLAAAIAGWLASHPQVGYDRANLYLSGTVANPMLNALGAALAVLGVSVAVWARYHLGRNWGQPMTLRQEPELVVSGPYAYIRNPIYTGVILAMVGSGLVNWWWLFISVAATVFFVWSTLVEERDMLRLFPTQYPAYKARTWRLVPWIF